MGDEMKGYPNYHRQCGIEGCATEVRRDGMCGHHLSFQRRLEACIAAAAPHPNLEVIDVDLEPCRGGRRFAVHFRCTEHNTTGVRTAASFVRKTPAHCAACWTNPRPTPEPRIVPVGGAGPMESAARHDPDAPRGIYMIVKGEYVKFGCGEPRCRDGVILKSQTTNAEAFSWEQDGLSMLGTRIDTGLAVKLNEGKRAGWTEWRHDPNGLHRQVWASRPSNIHAG